MRNQQLVFEIHKNVNAMQEGTFDVPSDCKHIVIKYDLSMDYTFLVYFVIRDSMGKLRFQKQLSYSEPVIQIGETGEDTTIGGIPGPIRTGEWSLKAYVFAEHVSRLLGDQRISFHLTISNEQEEIKECIGKNVWCHDNEQYSEYDFDQIYQTKARWYQGDLHTHTRLSDGKELPARANEKSKLMKMDFYVPTEHNVLHTGWPKTDVMIVPGVEITTILGHANLFGLSYIPTNMEHFLLHKDPKILEQDMEMIITQCKENHWLFSMNHPFLHIWKWNYDELCLDDLNCIEIVNDPTYAADPIAKAEEANQKAILLADYLWEDGYRICAIGGSDSHNTIDDWYDGADVPSIPGDPMTSLYMDKLSPRNFLEALKNCACYVTRHCQITTDLPFGQQFSTSTASFSFSLEIFEVKEQPVIYYIHNGEKIICEKVETVADGFRVEGCITFKNKEYDWVRFGAQLPDGQFLFYGNAITRGKRKHYYKKYGEIRKKLEERWRLKEYYSTKMVP